MNFNEFRETMSNTWVALSDAEYKQLGVELPDKALDNIDFQVSGDEKMTIWMEKNNTSMESLGNDHASMHDLVLTLKSKPILKDLVKKFNTLIKEIATNDLDGNDFPLRKSYMKLAKDYCDNINKLDSLLQKGLVDGFSHDKSALNIDLELQEETEFQFEPKKIFLIDIYKATFEIDISEMTNEQLKALYDINEEFDPSFTNILPLNDELLEVQKHHGKVYKASETALKNIERKLELVDKGMKTEESKYELTQKYLKAKTVHVKQEIILKSSIVVMRGLEVVAGADMVVGTIGMYYDLNKNGEVVESGESSTNANIPEIQPEV